MVWFQCEDCGDNLKKPKLPNHFRNCSASKLSCIDCGKIFGRHDVEGHTQCITESEKYGPKGQGNERNASNAKPNKSSVQKPDVDIHVGLSESAPWFCSLCNTKATSRQTLLLHADGKKHRAKARGFHAANAKQQPKEVEATITNISTENNRQNDEQENTGKENEASPTNLTKIHEKSVAENGDSKSSKKRNLEASENEGDNKKTGDDITSGLGHGEVIQVQIPETEARNQGKKGKQAVKGKQDVPSEENAKESSAKEEKDEKTIKWKKLITSTLRTNPDGSLKFKKLKKLVMISLKESGVEEDEDRVSEILEHKIESSSRFKTEGKCVRLVAKS